MAVAAGEAAGLAAELGRERRRAAQAFCRAVAEELEGLAMSRCRVEVAFSAPGGSIEAAGHRLGAAGAETAEILIAPNPGEPARPLGRVASGGELSRVLLAVKRALSRADPVRSYVFDEVDAGIGGAVAEAVGRVLAEVARDRQVICVTHLPQVAAFADLHARVEKRVAVRPHHDGGGPAPGRGRPARRGGAHAGRTDGHGLGARARGRPHLRAREPGKRAPGRPARAAAARHAQGRWPARESNPGR